MIDYDKVLSDKIKSIKPSGIRKFFDIAGTMEDVISLGVGEPDFNTPWAIRKSAIQVLERKHIIYGPNKGIAPLRNTISVHIEKKHGGYRVDIFGSIHSDSRDAAIILFLVTGTVLCACVLWISLISSASKEPIFEADEYGCRCGHGEYLICYLDNMDDYNLPLMFELAKCIVPGKDQRISRIQRMCAA